MRKINIEMGMPDTIPAPVDETLSVEGMAADAKATGDALALKAEREDLEAMGDRVTALETGSATKAELEALENRVDELEYAPIEISAFSVTPDKAEAGSAVLTAGLNYSMNQIPAAASLDGMPYAITAESGTIEQTGLYITNDRTWTLSARDERNANASKSATLEFLYKAYWGAAAAPGTINSAFLLSLGGSELTHFKERTFAANAGAGQYIWYAVPTFLGDCAFRVGGVEGGFILAAHFSHVNASGGVTDYDVYRSDNASLGETVVTVY